MAKQNDNNAVLADVARALRDINSVVLVDTVVDSMSSGVPSRWNKQANGTNPQSIKINKDITMRRIWNDGYFHYVVRTKSGEAIIQRSGQDFDDFLNLWGWAQHRYMHNNEQMSMPQMSGLAKNLKNPELNKIVIGPGTTRIPKDKYKEAASQLKGLGVEPNILAKHIAGKQNE